MCHIPDFEFEIVSVEQQFMWHCALSAHLTTLTSNRTRLRQRLIVALCCRRGSGSDTPASSVFVRKKKNQRLSSNFIACVGPKISCFKLKWNTLLLTDLGLLCDKKTQKLANVGQRRRRSGF